MFMLQSGLPHIIDFKINEIDARRFNEDSLDFDVLSMEVKQMITILGLSRDVDC